MDNTAYNYISHCRKKYSELTDNTIHCYTDHCRKEVQQTVLKHNIYSMRFSSRPLAQLEPSTNSEWS